MADRRVARVCRVTTPHADAQPSAAWGTAPAAAPGPVGAGAVPTSWPGGARRTSAWTDVVTVLGLTAVGLAALAGLGVVLLEVGMGPGAVGLLLALVPLALVLAGVRWLDTWEPEPRGALLFGLLWGAGVAVLLAVTVNDLTMWFVAHATGDPDAAYRTTALVSAPVVEEIGKGLGVLVIYLARRRYFDGVVDGIVYAGVVAAGFAFTENVLYFGQAGELLPQTFAMRGLATPFAHLLFTACTGAAIGWAARSRSRGAVLWATPLGLLAAMALHSAWNATALLAGPAFLALYLVVQVPVFVGVVALAFGLRRRERDIIAGRLDEYGRAGWFAPHEVQMLTSIRLRTQARRWAARTGGQAAGAAMHAFQRDATTLALRRQIALTGRADLRTYATTERDLLGSVVAHRHQVLATVGG